jgi:hypothetical protein
VDLRDKVLVVPGLISPESVRKAQELGAVGLIHINENDILHEMVATTVWARPRPRAPRGSEDSGRIDREGSGDRLRSAASRGQVAVKMVAQVDRAWTSIPLVVADVPGAGPNSSW